MKQIHIDVIIGALIKRKRRLLGIKQKDIAKYANISLSNYSRFERGEANITYSQLRVICPALKINAIDVLSETEEIIEKMFPDIVVIHDTRSKEANKDIVAFVENRINGKHSRRAAENNN